MKNKIYKKQITSTQEYEFIKCDKCGKEFNLEFMIFNVSCPVKKVDGEIYCRECLKIKNNEID